MPRTINCKCTPEYPFKVQVRSSPASRASLWPAARLVDALQDRPILYLAGHSLSDRMRTPVPVGRNTAREREREGESGRCRGKVILRHRRTFPELIIQEREVYVCKTPPNKERPHRVALAKVEIIHAVTSRTLLSSRGVLQSPLPFVLTLLYGVYTLLISREIRRSALWAVFTLQSPPLSTHIRLHSAPGGGEVPQEGIKRKTRSRTEIRSFQQGLKSGHESTPSPKRRYQDSLSGC